MLKEAQNHDTLRLIAASAILGFVAATFVVLHVALAFVPLRYYLPLVAEPLIAFLNVATAWTGIDVYLFQNGYDLAIALLLRFILLATVIAVPIFLAKPPKHLIARGTSEKFSRKNPFLRGKVEKWLASYYVLLFVLVLPTWFGEGFELVSTTEGDGDAFYFAMQTAYSALAVYLAIEFPLLALWRFGSKLAYPVLEDHFGSYTNA